MAEEALAAELRARADRDQDIRRRVEARSRAVDGRVPDDLAAEWERIDGQNTEWLADRVAEHGWPGRSRVGADAAGAAWLLAQHADRDPDVQRGLLTALAEAVRAGEAELAELAYLEDRVLVALGEPQRYGTQSTGNDEGQPEPVPIAERDRLDERRAAAGLEPFAEYERLMRER